MTEGTELLNQEKIRIFGEKEIFKYLGILEVNIIKQVEMEGKNLKMYISGERENKSNQTK